MKLSEQEKEEMSILLYEKSSRTQYMSKEKQKRLAYLFLKDYHNCCPNPLCTGHEGEEEETQCPLCGSELMKTIKI